MFLPGEVWTDTSGRPIQAHGGGILWHDGTYYWFGEDRQDQHRVVSCYSSRDLLRWQDEGTALAAVLNDPAHDLHPRNVQERPKVLFNARTQEFLLWLHIDDPNYGWARVGVAVSRSPAGPYRYLGSFRPDGQESRDMTVFQDRDGSAYLFFSSENNKTLRVARLADDYRSVAGPSTRNFIGQSREAPAVFRHGNRYFLVTSGCSGWTPNPASYAVAASPLGPWEQKQNPCVGPGADRTFGSQGTFVLPVSGKPNCYIFLADQWITGSLGQSRYVWLPLRVTGGRVEIAWKEWGWEMDEFDGEGRDRFYYLINQNSGLCLDVLEAGTNDGTRVCQWRRKSEGGANQQWQLRRDAEGAYRLLPRHTLQQGQQMCLDVADDNLQTGGKVHLWPVKPQDERGDNQLWVVTRLADGSYQIVSRLSGLCLEVADECQEEWNAARGEPSIVIQYPWKDGAHQRWRIEPV